MTYVYSLPSSESFRGAGMRGYTFGPLRHDSDVYYIVVEEGHDTFQISDKITRIYYVLSGEGYFTIDDHKYAVSPGMLVEVPPKLEYSYSGKMTLIGFSAPRWFRGNDKATRWNPDVDTRKLPDSKSTSDWASRFARLKLFGKSPARAYLRMNRFLWKLVPESVANLRPVHQYGTFLHRLALLQGHREQALNTFFLRNRPQLEVIRRLVSQKGAGEPLRVAILGCSSGPEAYSVAWTIKSARPDLELNVDAVDICREAVDIAKSGEYAMQPTNVTDAEMFERLTSDETNELFERTNGLFKIKGSLKDCIEWRVGDAREPHMMDLLGRQDIVIANNFLCHMSPPEAERCLHNIARLLQPQGYLIVSGIDLDVRTKVARDLRWNPVQDLIKEIHDGDQCLRRHWPCSYVGLEPLDSEREDWTVRYASVFQVTSNAAENVLVCDK
jgi:chemotaxis methyl-accepting protein methylase/mannose-6-phosphate isomerase-like protein (cupin superfamily)